MLKKRLIFSLLYSEGYFLQSRNFNLQKVGNIDWLKNNYNFKNISPYIDELIVLDVSRKDRNKAVFLQNVLLKVEKVGGDTGTLTEVQL